MNVITGVNGLTRRCGTEGCGLAASSVWYGSWPGKPVLACDAHNPVANTAMALPWGFTSQSLCHACGQPVRLGGAAC